MCNYYGNEVPYAEYRAALDRLSLPIRGPAPAPNLEPRSALPHGEHDRGNANQRGASALPLDAALAFLPSLPRPVLARLVTRMIDRLDQIDGDPELEEDNEDYGAEEIGEVEEGRIHPVYGIDQSKGPLSPHAH